MALLRSVREDLLLIFAIVAAVALTVLGILAKIGPFELSQILIVLVFLAIAATIAERISRYQHFNDRRIDTVEASLNQMKLQPPQPEPPVKEEPPAQLVEPAQPSQALQLVQIMQPILPPPAIQVEESVQEAQPAPEIKEVQPVPPAVEVAIPTIMVDASCNVEFLSRESTSAELVESIVDWAAGQNGTYRIFATAQMGPRRPDALTFSLPPSLVGHINEGSLGFMRVFLGRLDGSAGIEEVIGWMVTLRNKILPMNRDVLLRQVVVFDSPFIQAFICAPKEDKAEDTSPVHIVIGLDQTLKVTNFSDVVHLTMQYSTYAKSFFSDWVKFIQNNFDYEYSQQEEQAALDEKLNITTLDFNRVDQSVTDFFVVRILGAMQPPPISAPTEEERKASAARILKDEYLRYEWAGLMRALSKTRELLSSSLEVPQTQNA